MEEENKKSFMQRASETSPKTLGIIAIIFVIMVIISGTLLIKLFKENTKCQLSPFTYGANQISESSDVEITCSCAFSDPHYANFYFDKDKLIINEDWVIPGHTRLNNSNLNFSI